MPPLVPPGGHRHSEHKRSRRSPDRNGASAKRHKVDHPPSRHVDQTVTRAGKLALPPKPPSPTEEQPRPPTEQSTDPRRPRSEPSTDPRKRPPEPPQNPNAPPSTEASSDARLRALSKPNFPNMVPLSSHQQGGVSSPATPADTMPPSTASTTTYFDQAVSNRMRDLKRQIADKQTEVCTLAVARKHAKDNHEDLANTAPKRGSSEYVQQAQAKEAWERLKSAEATLKRAQDEHYRLLAEEVRLQEKSLSDACDSICRRFSQTAGTKGPGVEWQENKDDSLKALETKLETRIAAHISQAVESKLDARLTAAKAILKTEIGPVIDQKLADSNAAIKIQLDQKLADERLAIKTQMLPIIDQQVLQGNAALQTEVFTMDKKLGDERKKRSKLFQEVDERFKRLQDEDWEFQKAGLTTSAVKKWSQTFEAHDSRIKTLEQESKSSRRSPTQEFQGDRQNNEKRTQALERDLAKLKKDLSTNDQRLELSNLEAKIQAVKAEFHKLQEMRSADNSESDSNHLVLDIKSLREQVKNLEKADATSKLQADLDLLKSKINILGDTFEKHQKSSAENDPQKHLQDLQARTKALETADYVKASTLDGELERVQKAVSDNDSRNGIQTLKAQSKVLDEIIEQLHTTSRNDLQPSLQRLEVRVEAVEATNSRQLEGPAENSQDMENRVAELEGWSKKFECDLEWIRRCIDHRNPDFRNMPLYRFMCQMQMSSRHGVNGHPDSCTPQDMMHPDLNSYFDPATYEYKATPLAAYLSDRFRRLKQDSLQYVDDRVKEVSDGIQHAAQSVDNRFKQVDGSMQKAVHSIDARCKELEEKFESEKVGDLWDGYADVKKEVQVFSQKVEELRLRLEGLPARAQGEDRIAKDELEELRQRCDQLKQEIDGQPKKADGVVAVALPGDAIRESAHGEICNFEKAFRVLETQAKQDGRRLKNQVDALAQAAKDLKDQTLGLQQAVGDIKDLKIIKFGQRHLDLFSNNLRDFQDNFLPSVHSKLSALEKQQAQQAQLFPDLVGRARQQEANNQNFVQQISLLQFCMASMAKRFAPAHHVPPEWEMTAASANQGGHARVMPSRPHSAVQGVQYR